MKVKFKKKYEEWVTWPEIIEDFLEVVSEKFGYKIDVFDLLQMPDSVVQHRLGRLLSTDPSSVTYNNAYISQARKTIERKKFADETREKWRKAWEAGDLWGALDEKAIVSDECDSACDVCDCAEDEADKEM